MEERLQKVLARAGIASRRRAEELILEGRVTVNGRTVRELGTKVDPAIDAVAVDTIPLSRSKAAGDTPRTYLLLYKPKGVVCTAKDTHGRTTVLDLVPPFEGKRLWPVGRLDEDSEGIVLLTDDGALTDRLTHPRYGVPKVYEVRVKGRIDRESAAAFERGVWLSEGRTGRSRVFIERAGREVSHIRVTLTEGRNREIRRAFAKIGFPVLSIRRIQLGPVVGRGLESGQYRPLAKDEVAALHASAGGEGTNEPMRRSHRTRRRPSDRDEGGTAGRPAGPARRTFRDRGRTRFPSGADDARPARPGRPPRPGRPAGGGRRGGKPDPARTGGWRDGEHRPSGRPTGRPTGRPPGRSPGGPRGRPEGRPGGGPRGRPDDRGEGPARGGRRPGPGGGRPRGGGGRPFGGGDRPRGGGGDRPRSGGGGRPRRGGRK